MKKFNTVTYKEAQDVCFNLIKEEPTKENISIFEALERVLAQNVMCQKNLPSYNNSALDGFAFNYTDNGKTLKIKYTIFAGMSIKESLREGECYKIMTGAKVPNDADTIIPFENCVSYDDNIANIGEKTKKGNALRIKGEEQEIGNILFHKGTIISSQVIAMLASQGISIINVYKKLNIAIFSTGDELKEPWENASEDEIYNVNSSALQALLKQNGFDAQYCGVIPDNLDDSIKYFSKMKKYDAIVTSGGISMGEADFIEEALKANGFKSSFHGINIKPGKPTMFGKMQNTLVSSMPGNPLAAYVNAFLFLVPTLKKMQGCSNFEHQYITALNNEEFKVRKGRVNLALGQYSDGKFSVFGQNKYGSGMLTPMVNSNAILVSDEDDETMAKDELVKIYLMN